MGMRAKKVAEDEPDVIESAQPVADAVAIKSRILDLVGQLVEPGIEGVGAEAIEESPGSKSGFVVIYIPASEGPPRRSRKDWKFYLRIGSGTFPMEYFQIADMFGHRPRPRLEIFLEHHENRKESEKEWVVFRGGIDDVIFPGTTTKIAELYRPIVMLDQYMSMFGTRDNMFSAEVSCEGMETKVLQREVKGTRLF